MGSRDGWRGINEERKKRYIFELTTDLIFFSGSNRRRSKATGMADLGKGSYRMKDPPKDHIYNLNDV